MLSLLLRGFQVVSYLRGKVRGTPNVRFCIDKTFSLCYYRGLLRGIAQLVERLLLNNNTLGSWQRLVCAQNLRNLQPV